MSKFSIVISNNYDKTLNSVLKKQIDNLMPFEMINGRDTSIDNMIIEGNTYPIMTKIGTQGNLLHYRDNLGESDEMIERFTQDFRNTKLIESKSCINDKYKFFKYIQSDDPILDEYKRYNNMIESNYFEMNTDELNKKFKNGFVPWLYYLRNRSTKSYSLRFDFDFKLSLVLEKDYDFENLLNNTLNLENIDNDCDNDNTDKYFTIKNKKK